MIERLFVYGSLAAGRPNEHILATVLGSRFSVLGSWQPASVSGRLRDEGWSVALGFPGLDLDGYGETIKGFVFSSEALAEHWERLDEFEGDAYRRTLADVRLGNGQTMEAYVYSLRPRPG